MTINSSQGANYLIENTNELKKIKNRTDKEIITEEDERRDSKPLVLNDLKVGQDEISLSSSDDEVFEVKKEEERGTDREKVVDNLPPKNPKSNFSIPKNILSQIQKPKKVRRKSLSSRNRSTSNKENISINNTPSIFSQLKLPSSTPPHNNSKTSSTKISPKTHSLHQNNSQITPSSPFDQKFINLKVPPHPPLLSIPKFLTPNRSPHLQPELAAQRPPKPPNPPDSPNPP